MASDLRDMHRAILLDPYDDVARLAYADALEESGDATRAKRVRDSMASPHVGSIVGVPEWRDGTWGDVYHCVERRGLVDEWRCTLDDFMDHAGPVFAAHPITEVRFTDRVPGIVVSETDWYMWRGCVGARLGTSKWSLPDEFFTSERRSAMAFREAAQAYAWAGRAAVNYGRHRAGLPTLGVRARA